MHEFYCGGCGKHHPIERLASKTPSGKPKCSACKAKVRNYDEKKAKRISKQTTKKLRQNVDSYIRCLGIS